MLLAQLIKRKGKESLFANYKLGLNDKLKLRFPGLFFMSGIFFEKNIFFLQPYAETQGVYYRNAQNSADIIRRKKK